VGSCLGEAYGGDSLVRTGPRCSIPLDVTDAKAVFRVISDSRPDWVLHLAAVTDLELCERVPDRAYAVNQRGTGVVADACSRLALPLVYVSSSAIFDGEKPTPYIETDSPSPVSVYGQTKLLGESEVVNATDDYLIVRTSWLFGGGEWDRKFVGQFLRRIMTTTCPIEVVADRYGSPTHAVDLLAVIGDLVVRGVRGVVHVANDGVCSRDELAREMCAILGRPTELVMSVRSSSRPQLVRRTRSEALASTVLPGLDLRLGPWSVALRKYLLSAQPVSHHGPA
jgi:dTDP-4-dehydrorhamnose reductase